MKNKGQVYPSDSLSILNLLPAAILTLTALLSQEEQEVLAYMITRSTTLSKTKTRRNKSFNTTTTTTHNPPLFHCECFHCYTTYWFRWDSSPNRELIHQAIEAFEDHLNTTQQQQQQSKKKAGKKRDKTPRKTQTPPPEVEVELELRSQSEEVTTTVGAAVTAAVSVSVGQQKGLARRVLPDVLGLLNSRWWSLWSPNV